MPSRHHQKKKKERPRPPSDRHLIARQEPRDIERTTTFKKDFKREKKGQHGKTLEGDLLAILSKLIMDQPLDQRHSDHALSGQWKDHRDCHIKPDLVLIYRKAEPDKLQLVRLGSHSELGI